MPLPNFLCVGAHKSGTTSLHDILRQHPDIYLPEIKETKFFARNDRFNKGIEFYKNEFFSKWKGEKAIGEIDPCYMFFDYVPERIRKFLGDKIKFIFIVRNPVDRAYSHYWMTCKRAHEDLSFEEAIEAEPSRQDGYFNLDHFSYISRGLYAAQIKRFTELFSKKNMLFIIFDDEFLQQREKTIERILSFLNVEKLNLNVNIKSNPAQVPRFRWARNFVAKTNILRKIGKIFIPSAEKRKQILEKIGAKNSIDFSNVKLTDAYKKYLIERFYLQDIKQLEKIIERDLSIWR